MSGPGLLGLTLRRLRHGYEGDGRPGPTPGNAAQIVIVIGLLVLAVFRLRGVDLSPARLMLGALVCVVGAALAAWSLFKRRMS